MQSEIIFGANLVPLSAKPFHLSIRVLVPTQKISAFSGQDYPLIKSFDLHKKVVLRLARKML